MGLLTDETVASYKEKPVIPLEERVKIFKSLRIVDLVVIQNDRDPTETLQKLWDLGIHIDVLYHGDDWLEVPGKDWIESKGGRLIQPPYYPYQSTTKIVEKILHR